MYKAELSARFSSLSLFALLVVFLFSASTFAQSRSIWTQIDESAIPGREARPFTPDQYSVFRLNIPMLKAKLSTAPLEGNEAERANKLIVEMPMPDGSVSRFFIEESPTLAPHIAVLYPHIKTYQGYGVDDRTATARFDFTNAGFHAYMLTSKGTLYINPYSTKDTRNYIVFEKQSLDRGPRQYHCEVDRKIQDVLDPKVPEVIDFSPVPEADFSHGTQLRTYRVAIGTTFEYTSIFRQPGDTDAQASERGFERVVTSINRISGVFRKEFAADLQLVSTTATVYAVNPETPANYSNTGSPDLNANVTNLNAAYTLAGYDIGHVFGSSDNGVAELESVCGSTKARGYSGQPNPTGDPFDVDYVAHEMGHQFGANHTFNSVNNCGSSPAAARREPGSGVTIMSYVGICSSTANPQRNAIDTYHVYNTQEILNFLSGAGGTCGSLSGTNAVPVVAALPNYTIPYNTPFTLTASATDADNEPLTYDWEQSDPGAGASSYPGTTDDDDISLVFRPGFRSYLPTTSPTRTFPSMPYILNNLNEAPITFAGTGALGQICHVAGCITGEDLPSAARTMNFRVTVRDGVGGISDAGTVLTVVNTGTPFKVTSPNAATLWNAGSIKTITWDTAGTAGGSINAANVKISLSTNGGTSFDTVLLASTPNDGTQEIVVPALDTTQARIKVEAVGNIFFDVSDANFSVTSAPATNGFLAGRITNAAGRGINNVRVVINTGSATYVTATSSFGYFIFAELPFGSNYTVTPQVKRSITFTPPSIVLDHNSDNFSVNFVGQ